MTLDDKVRVALGSLLLENMMLQLKIEEAAKRVQELEPKKEPEQQAV